MAVKSYVTGESLVKLQNAMVKVFSSTSDPEIKSGIANAYRAMERNIARDAQNATEAEPAVDRASSRKLDMQKKKEDRLEEKNPVDSLQIKKDRAKKQLDDYLQSDEYKQKQEERNRKANDQWLWQSAMDAMMGNPGGTQNQPEADPTETRLREANAQAQAEADAAEIEAVMQTDLDTIASMSDEDRQALELYAVDRDKNFAADPMYQMPQSGESQALIAKYGKTKVEQLANTYMRQENRKLNEEVSQKAYAYGQDHEFLGSVATVGANLLDGLTGLPGVMRDLGHYDSRYSTLDPNSNGALSAFSGSARQAVGDNIRGDVYDENGDLVQDGGVGRDLLAMLYEGGMSFADNAARAAVTGGSSIVGSALMASSSFGNAVREASAQGASPAQAVVFGAGSAGLEYLTEKIPMDEMMDVVKGGKQSLKQTVWNILKQGFEEASTEELSLIATNTLEAILLGEKSADKQRIADLVANGMDYQAAKVQVIMEGAKEALRTFAVSGIAGGMSGAASSGVANLRQKRADKAGSSDTKAARGSAQERLDAYRARRAAEAEAAAQEAAQQPQSEPMGEVPVQAEQVPTPAQMPTQEAVQAPTLQQETPAQPRQGGSIEDAAAMLAEQFPVQQTQDPPDVQAAKRALGDDYGARQSEDTTVVNTDPAQHTPQEQAVINAYQDSVDDNLVEYVEAVKNNPGQKMPRYPLKDVSDRAAEDIKRLTGVDVSGNKTQIEARIVEHIIKDHGESGQSDQSMRDVNDIGRLQYIIDNYDTIEHGGTSSAYVYQNKHGRNAHAQTVVMKKKVNGTYFVVEAVPDTKKKTLYIVSAYMSKNGQKETASSLSGDAETPRVTSDNATKSDAVSNEVPQTTNVNGPSVTPEAESTVTSREATQSTNADYPGVMPNGKPAGTSSNSIADTALEVNQNQPDMQSTPTADTQNQSAEGGQGFEAMGAADRNFTGTAAYDDLLTDGNVQRSRKGDGRTGMADVEVPKTDADGRLVSEFVSNSMNSELTPAVFTDTIKKLVAEGQVSHDVQTNEESLNRAAEAITADGDVSTSVDSVCDFAKGGNTSPEMIAKATLLYQTLTQEIDRQSENGGQVDGRVQKDAEKVFLALSDMATASGRSLQLFNLFRKMTPEGQVRTIKSQVENQIKQLQKRGTVKKNYQHQFDQELLDWYREDAEAALKAKTPKSKAEAEARMQETANALFLDAAAKVPATMKAKWDAWRYMSMLCNAKTQIRNIGGNAMMMPYNAAKRTVGALIEKGLKQGQRTKAFHTDAELLQWAKGDRVTDTVHNALEGSGKLGDDTRGNAVADDLKVFDIKALEKVRTLTNGMVSGGDMLFKNAHYAKNLANFLTARGVKLADIQNGTVSQDVMNEARNYAVNEAMKATFNDSNALSDTLASMRFSNPDNAAKKAINMLGEGIMPFRKTPANVVMRFKDYSPAGLAQGLWNAALNVHNGKVSAATAIDQIAAGLTGTAMMGLGYALAGGLFGFKITGSGTDEDEERQGHQDYAIEFSVNGEEYSYTIDWAAPANLPLFLGANLRQFSESGDTASFLTAMMNAGAGVLEPLLELSCLSSLNDLVEGARYAAEGEAVYTLLSKAATSYFTQGIPSLLRQADQAMQGNKQATFANDADPIIRKAQQAAANIPFLGDQFKTDKLNAWGETETEDDWVTRTVNAFLNPGTLKKIDNSALEQEITRLNEVQEENVSPPSFSKVASYTDKSGNVHQDVRLTEEQYQTMATTQGQMSKDLITKLMDDKDYAAMTDEQKAKAFGLVYDYARETAEQKVFADHEGYSSSWMEDAAAGDAAGYIMDKITHSEISSAMSGLDNAWDKNYTQEITDRWVNDLDIAYQSYTEMSDERQEDVRDFATGTTAKYIEARDAGVEHKQAVATLKKINSLTPETGYDTVRDIQEREAIANMSGISDKAKDALMKAYMTDYNPDAKTVYTTELKYDYARQELGLTPAEYVRTYRVALDGGKKAEKLEKWKAMGYTAAEANILYRLYSATGNTKIDVVAWRNS